MKCFAAIVLFALCAIAFAEEKPAEPENHGHVSEVAAPDVPRDKRGVLLSYTAPLYSPIRYSLPYAYRSYPYYYNNYYL